MTNPLLQFNTLPQFADIRPEHVTPAIEELLMRNRALVEQLTTQAPATWNDFVAPLEDANEQLSRAWGQVSHLNAVVNTPELREVYNANLPKVTQYWAELSQHAGLFSQFKRLANSAELASLSATRQRIVEHELRDFRLGGAELPPAQQQRFLEIQEELAAVSAKFEENVLDTTNEWSITVHGADEVAGIPDDVLTVAAEAAKKDGVNGWKLTLHMPCYLPVMQYAEHRPLRETLYRAYCTRASEFGKPEWDNTANLSRILQLRQEAAQLLGFDNYAALSLEPKMAESAQQVVDFLRQLGHKAKPFAARDLQELSEFAATELGLSDLQAWDVGYASEKLRVARYAFSDLEVKQYFTEPQVMAGLFNLLQRLYGLQANLATAPVWHPTVRFYDLVDRTGTLIGQFYLDLYARTGKRGGAWMDDAMGRRRTASGVQIPVAYLNCNFSAPVGDKPALFTHDEVITLFHEFGHGLHHMMTQIEDLGVSGINGVEWDAVELPSQFMENFCWEWEVLSGMARHVESGEPLPRPLYDRMLAAKNFQSGLQTVRQLEFALFDMLLHMSHDPHGPRTYLDVLNDVRQEIAVIIPPAYNRYPASFNHIFAGGYAAGYYSYKWAEVLSADAYALFEEQGGANPEVGQRFWTEILAVGGSRPALESFRAFRGRDPEIDALLRHNGMTLQAA